MTYKAQLYPWCIIRPFPNMRVQIVGRFRNRSDAEGHLQILKRLMPNIPYQIMFDIPLENSDFSYITIQQGHDMPCPYSSPTKIPNLQSTRDDKPDS
jgi:hypothetical protein